MDMEKEFKFYHTEILVELVYGHLQVPVPLAWPADLPTFIFYFFPPAQCNFETGNVFVRRAIIYQKTGYYFLKDGNNFSQREVTCILSLISSRL